MCFATKLTHRFDHLSHSAAVARMVVAQSAAVGVYRDPAAAGDKAAVDDEASAFALGAEAQVFELDEDGDSEAVVNRCVADVGGCHARFGKGGGTGPGGS